MKSKHLSDGSSIRQGAKCDFLACLEDVSQPRSETPATSCIVLDGAVIVQMLKPATSFNEYAQEVFMPYILSKFQQTTPLDLVWDHYPPDSLKGTTRAKRGKGSEDEWWAVHPSPPTGQLPQSR